MTISFIDLKAQQQRIKTEIQQGIAEVLRHGNYIMGPEVQEFEEKLADFVGVKYCVGVSSGTDALLMVLMAKGIGPGDAVFTTPFTFIATAEVISLLGGTPVFVDIDPRTYNIDPAKLKLAIQAVKNNDKAVHPLPLCPRLQSSGLTPKCIIPVDLFGLPADYDPIMEIAKEHDMFVLEDAAQGLGGVYKGRRAGGLGHAGATSFFPAKPLGCYGDGGAILTNDDELAELSKSIRVHGKGTEKYDNRRIGLNARLHTMQAAILLPKLAIFQDELDARQKVAEKYTELLASSGVDLALPHVGEGYRSAWAQYSVLAKSPEERMNFQELAKKKGVPTMVYYPTPLHMQTAYAGLGYQEHDFPISVKTSRQIFSLPMHPYLDEGQIKEIIKAIA